MPEDVVGFVYMITNTTNGRMYIGKKLAKFKRSRPPLKGRRNKRRYKVNSDWQDYYGSSDDLTLDVNRLGKDKFSREILFYCKSKAELSYVEAREQFARKVLESNDYYNGHIRVRVHGLADVGPAKQMKHRMRRLVRAVAGVIGLGAREPIVRMKMSQLDGSRVARVFDQFFSQRDCVQKVLKVAQQVRDHDQGGVGGGLGVREARHFGHELCHQAIQGGGSGRHHSDAPAL